MRLFSGTTVLFEECQQYVDRRMGQSDCNIMTDGEHRFLRHNANGWRVVFDVGANVGNWTRLLLSLNPNLEVHCFEPSQNAFRALVDARLGGNVHLSDFGLGSSAGQQTLYHFGGIAELASLYRREGIPFGEDTTEVVRLETFDDYREKTSIDHVDFVKLDVEGHELAVLQGMRRSLEAQRVGIVQFEYGGCNIDSRVLLKDLFGFFRQFGYSLRKLLPTRVESIPEYAQVYENFRLQNWLAVRPGVAVRT